MDEKANEILRLKGRLSRLREDNKWWRDDNRQLYEQLSARPTVEEFRRVKQELFLTRHAMLGMVPDPVARELLQHYQGLVSIEEALHWRTLVVQRVVDMVVQRTKADIQPEGWERQRTLCPLCGDRPDQNSGWLVPIGLERHLLGEHKARECDVMRAALELAKGSARHNQEQATAGWSPPHRNSLILEWEAERVENSAEESNDGA